MKPTFFFLVFITLFGCGIDDTCQEKVTKDCVMSKEYNPVCGCNNKTYVNPSEALCNGITDFTSGKCPINIIGKWQLTEVNIDPGNGSGTFVKVKSTKTIEIDNEYNITSNGDLCSLSIENDKSTKGKINLTKETIDIKECEGRIYKFIQNGDSFIIVYLCFEGCQIKYDRIK